MAASPVEILRRLSAEELVAFVGLPLSYVVFGMLTVLSGVLLSEGVDPLFLVCATGVITFLLFFPLALYIEREKWPRKLGGKLLFRFLLISLGWVTIYQGLLMVGLQKTSPAVSCAMSNLCPGLVFFIACCLRFEKFDILSKYSIAKTVGTLLCLVGAVAISLLQNTNSPDSSASPLPIPDDPNREWVTGCLYLFVAVFVYSCTMVLQASTMVEFPAPLSLTTITSLIGGLFLGLFLFVSTGKLDPGNHSMSTILLSAYLIAITMVGACCFGFQIWCIKKQGPVFMAVISPIGTLTSVILSAVILRKFLSPGSLAGIAVMLVGLYIVLWAKVKESSMISGNVHPYVEKAMGEVDDVENPLLN